MCDKNMTIDARKTEAAERIIDVISDYDLQYCEVKELLEGVQQYIDAAIVVNNDTLIG